MDPRYSYVAEALDNKDEIVAVLTDEMEKAARNLPPEQVNPSVEVDVIVRRTGVSPDAVLFLVREKLSEYTCVRGTIIRTGNRGGCFIATAAYGSTLAPELVAFRRFRDEVLLASRAGRLVVRWYYRLSPPLASLISRSAILQITARRVLLQPILRLLRARDRHHIRAVR
jgi:hypothetical protein